MFSQGVWAAPDGQTAVFAVGCYAKHPQQPYIVIHDKPKVEQLRRRFPELYR